MPTGFSDKTKDFMDEIFGEFEGFVCAPTKTRSGYFQQYFFKWPEQKTDLLTHITEQSRTVDVYLSPSLFNDHSTKKVDWKGSHYVWVEFDGNAPQTKELPSGIPAPSIQIQSSETGHEHWYWRLHNFETDSKVLESLSKQLSYTLRADLSGWDCGQVLRPPGTLHHESRRRVRLVNANRGDFGYNDFTGLVTVPAEVEVNTNIKDMPNIKDVIAKYRWPGEVFEMFNRSSQPVGKRSSAYTRMAFHCIEMGMTNEETFAVLWDCDDRWGKFKSRNDRKTRLIGIINYVRTEKTRAQILEITDRPISYTVGDLIARPEAKLDWVFNGLLTERGYGLMAANPGIGKSTMSFQLAIKSILGLPFLIWENQKKMRPLIWSLDMQDNETTEFFRTMLMGYTGEQQEEICKTLRVVPWGSRLALNSKNNQQMFLEEIDAHESNFIIIDSFRQINSKMDMEEIGEVHEFLNKELRSSQGDRKCTIWVVHHLRKPPNEGSRKPQDINDLYGDQYIGATATGALALWSKGHNVVEVMNFKTRMAAQSEAFHAKRNQYLDFEVIDDPVPDAPVVRKDKKVVKETSPSGNINM